MDNKETNFAMEDVLAMEKLEKENRKSLLDSLKDLLHPGMAAFIEADCRWWQPEQVVLIDLVPDAGHASAVIRGEKNSLVYKWQQEKEFAGNHIYVWQTTGVCEDDYRGFMLIPLRDMRYLKISYSC